MRICRCWRDIRSMYDQVFDRFGAVDVLVNNAGISSEVYFLDATEEMFDHMTAVDWKGVYFSSQIAAKRMIEQQIRGVIINNRVKSGGRLLAQGYNLWADQGGCGEIH